MVRCKYNNSNMKLIMRYRLLLLLMAMLLLLLLLLLMVLLMVIMSVDVPVKPMRPGSKHLQQLSSYLPPHQVPQEL
jgi:hypothetical protein